MRSIVALLILLSCCAEPFPDDTCEAVCRGLQCEEDSSECVKAALLYGCACRPAGALLEAYTAGRGLLEASTAARFLKASTAAGCAQPCFGDARGCDAFVPLGATCVDLETNLYFLLARSTCDCTGCSLCDETDAFAPAVDACDGGDGGAVSEISTEAELTAALDAGAPCTAVSLGGDLPLGAAAYFSKSVRLVGAGGPARPVLSPALGPHRLVAVVDQASVSLTSVVLRDGFDAFAGGCIFVGGGSALTLDRVALENCAAGAFGGGVAAWTAASLGVSRSSFDGGIAGILGGALYGHTRSTVVLAATAVGRSSALVGGGIAVMTAATLEVSGDSIIERCSVTNHGGALFAGRGAVATLSSGSVLSDSHAAGGGGAYYGFSGSALVLKGIVVSNCTANVGGGVQILSGATINADDCAFRNCVARTDGGGGVNVDAGGVGTFSKVDFLNCTAPNSAGGGLAVCAASSATLSDSTFVGCAAGTNGGGISAAFAGTAVSLSRTSLSRCSATGDGGALFLAQDCRASIFFSVFLDNAAEGSGGAMSAGAASRIAVFGETRVERNVAADDGGGLALLAGSIARLSSSVVADNVAGGGGGGAFVCSGATLHLGRETILRGNVAALSGGAVEVRGVSAQLYVSASCSFVQVTLDWTAALTLAAEASVLFDYAGSPGGPGRDARGVSARFVPQNGLATLFEACLPPGSGHELWAASPGGSGWFQGSWALTLPPQKATVLSLIDSRVTFVQAVNEFGVLGVSAAAAHGALAAVFSIDGDDASFPDAAVRIFGNVAVSGDGGGVSVLEAGRAVLYEAVFDTNAARLGHGGGIYVGEQSTADLRKVRMDSNSAALDGGAMQAGTLAVLNISNSTFTANVAGVRGGSLGLDRVRSASMQGVVARGNRAGERGGALALVLCDQKPVVVVSNSTFELNSATLGSGAIDIGARSLVSACGAPSVPVLQVNGATLFAGNSVDSGSGGGLAVRPSGASISLSPQPEACLAVLRVVVDWRRNAQRCGVAAGLDAGADDETCDAAGANCAELRGVGGANRCDGCTCKAALPGLGESYFHVDRVSNGTPAFTLFVGEPDAGAAKTFKYCLGAGDYEVTAYDRRGSKWFGGTMEAMLWNFDSLEPAPSQRAVAAWGRYGLTGPLRFQVAAVPQKDLAVRFVDNAALKGGGAGVFWAIKAPAGLAASEAFSSGNKAAYGSFAATPVTTLLVNTSSEILYAVPNAAMSALKTVLLDGYGQVVSSDSNTVVSATLLGETVGDSKGKVQASGLVAVCKYGVATFDAIQIQGLPGDTHSLGFLTPASSLKTNPLPVELTSCPVGFTERKDSETALSCIPCEYSEYFSDGRCVPCPPGSACGRYPPLDATSASVGYQLFTLETLPIKVGYYRFFADSDEIYECADASYCSAADCSCTGVGYEEAFRDSVLTYGSRLCIENAEGPLCALCAAGHYPRPSSLGEGGGCALCDGESVLPIFFAVVVSALIVGLGLVSALVVGCAGAAKTRKRVLQAASFAKQRWTIVAVVQIWYAVSTVSRFVAIEEVDYPEPLQTILQYLGFLSFDLSFVMPSLQCNYSMTYFELFLAWALFPFAFGAFLAVGVLTVAAARLRKTPWPKWPTEIIRHLTRTEVGRATRKSAISLFWLVLVLMHNYICSVIFTFYSCSEAFAVSQSQRESWLVYDFEVRCGSDAYHSFAGAATTLLLLYVLIVPASLLLKLKMNRLLGRDDGSLSFFTRHVRPAYWYYEIVALEVRLIICGALVPTTTKGLRLAILLVVIFAWMTMTREMRPYINRGHMALVNFLQIFVMSAIALALILFAELLSAKAAKVFAAVVSAISVAITFNLYRAFKNEEVTEVLELIKARKPFDRESFLRLRVGMNVRAMDDAVFSAALAILDDETGPKPKQAKGPVLEAGAADAAGWVYLTTHLLPLRDVWMNTVPTQAILATHEDRLISDAQLLVRTRAMSAPPGRVLQLSLKQFSKDVDILFGPLAEDLQEELVTSTFQCFAAASQPQILSLQDFPQAVRAILDAVILQHAAADQDEETSPLHDPESGEETLKEAALRGGERAPSAAALQAGDLASPQATALLLSGTRPAVPKRLASLRIESELSDDSDTPETPGTLEDGGSPEDRGARSPSRARLLRLRVTGQKPARVSPQPPARTFPPARVGPSPGHSDVESPSPSSRSLRPTKFASGEAGKRHKETFFDLAVHAHAANFKCLIVMEEAAAAILAEPDWGGRLAALEDFSEGPGAVLQAPLRDPLLAAWTAKLGGESLRDHFDESVLPHALRSVALDAHPAFVAALRKILCVEAGNDDDEEKSPAATACWPGTCELYKAGAATAVKGAARMIAKIDEYRGEEDPASTESSAPWPHAARITDPLRATIVCDDAEAIVRAYEALCGGGADGDAAAAHPFRVTRLKNKLALCTKPFNLHVNCAFDRGEGVAPITVEVQIVPRAVNVVMAPSHKFYSLSRAPHAGALPEY